MTMETKYIDGPPIRNGRWWVEFNGKLCRAIMWSEMAKVNIRITDLNGEPVGSGKAGITRHCKDESQPPPIPEPLVWPEEPTVQKAIYRGSPAWAIDLISPYRNAVSQHHKRYLVVDEHGRRFFDELPDDCEIVGEHGYD